MGKKKHKVRNPFHNHPLLGKGAAHRKSQKTIRRREKVKLKSSDFGRNEDLAPSISVAKLVMHQRLKFN